MFRSILKFPRLISRRLFVSDSRHGKPVNVYAYSSNYFLGNPKYTVFNPADDRIYEFDAGTDEPKVSDILSIGKPFPWTLVPTESTNVDLIATLKSISDYCRETNTSLTSEQFDEFIDEIARRLPKFTTNEAICALQISTRIPMTVQRTFKTRNFAELFIGLDQATSIKAANWSLQQLLFVGSIWSAIESSNQTYFGRFYGHNFNKLAHTMTPEQLALSICHLQTFKQPMHDERKFENIFERNIDALTAHELAFCCRNVMRMQSTLTKPELCEKLLKRLLGYSREELDELSDTLMAAILYVVFRSVKARNGNDVTLLLRKLQPSMAKRTLRTCIYIADVGSYIHVGQHDITEYTLHRCLSEPNALKSLIAIELERLSRIIGIMNFTSASGLAASVGKAILNELRNRIDLLASRSFHATLIRVQRNLLLVDIYDMELLANTLRPDYIRLMHGGSKQLPIDMYKLDAYARLNLAGIYKGDLLKDENLAKLGKFLTDFQPHEMREISVKYRFIMDVAECVRKEFGHFVYANAVNHCKEADIFVGIDTSTGEPIDCTYLFPPPYTGQLIPAHMVSGDNPNLKIFAFVAANVGLFCVGDNRVTGTLRQRLQQLELLGYHAVMIEQKEWEQTDVGDQEKLIRRKFLQKLQTI